MKRKVSSMVAAALVGGVLLTWKFGAAAWPFDDEGEIPTLAPLLSRVTPAVVNVAVVGEPRRLERNPLLDDPLFRRFFGLPEDGEAPQLPPQQGIGSGVIVDADEGLIVTNHHVVLDASNITVTTNDRRVFQATVVGSDPGTDIALLRVDRGDQPLAEIEFGDSDAMQVGDYVVAIGNPFGLGQTATAGIVSALGRSGVNIESYEDFIQTDASINPGNSGGALIGLDGKLLGVNTAILSSMGGNIGIGFAIPSNMARKVMEQLREYGEVRRGQLGILIQDVTPGLATALELSATEGALVTQVNPGSPAEQAGIMPGDVVVAVNGESVRSGSELRNEIGLIRVGETVTLTVLRGTETLMITATVGEAPDQAVAGGPQGGRDQPSNLAALEGAELRDIQPGHPLYGTVEGVLVVAVRQGSPAWRQQLRPNDVITGVNRQPVRNVQELSALLEQARRPFALQVQREGRPLFLLIQ